MVTPQLSSWVEKGGELWQKGKGWMIIMVSIHPVVSQMALMRYAVAFMIEQLSQYCCNTRTSPSGTHPHSKDTPRTLSVSLWLDYSLSASLRSIHSCYSECKKIIQKGNEWPWKLLSESCSGDIDIGYRLWNMFRFVDLFIFWGWLLYLTGFSFPVRTFYQEIRSWYRKWDNILSWR